MSKWVMMGVWSWFAGAMLSAFMTGTFLGATQQAVLDKLQLFTFWKVGGWTLPVINFGFFDGLWSIMQPGNFAFLASSPLLIFVYLLNIGLVVGFLTLFSGVVTSFIRR